MIWRKALAAGVAAAVLAAAGWGCILSPRSPDGPPEEPPTDWQTPVNTDIVLENLTAAFEGKGLSNYRDCFADSFRFHVDPQDSLDAGQEAYDRYANWTRDDEEQVANAVFTDAGDISLTLTTTEETDETSGDMYRKEEYSLTISWQSGPHVSEEILYRGVATLYMRRDLIGRWAIYRWVDRRVDTVHETWGVLRGDYRG
jgi:hypothetical protein